MIPLVLLVGLRSAWHGVVTATPARLIMVVALAIVVSILAIAATATLIAGALRLLPRVLVISALVATRLLLLRVGLVLLLLLLLLLLLRARRVVIVSSFHVAYRAKINNIAAAND